MYDCLRWGPDEGGILVVAIGAEGELNRVSGVVPLPPCVIIRPLA